MSEARVRRFASWTIDLLTGSSSWDDGAVGGPCVGARSGPHQDAWCDKSRARGRSGHRRRARVPVVGCTPSNCNDIPTFRLRSDRARE